MKKNVFFAAALIACIVMSCAFAEDLSDKSLDELLLQRETIQQMLDALDEEITRRQKDNSKTPEDFGIWEIASFVDEFDQPTDERYVRNVEPFTGTFSTVSANNRNLDVYFSIDAFYADIMLYRYGDRLLKNGSSKYSDDYNILMMDSNKERYELYGIMPPNGDRIRLDCKSRILLEKALNLGGTVQFVIKNSEYETEEYKFSIEDASAFQTAYTALLGDAAAWYRFTEVDCAVGEDIPEGVYDAVSVEDHSILWIYPTDYTGPLDYHKIRQYDFWEGNQTLRINGIEFLPGERFEVHTGKLELIPKK